MQQSKQTKEGRTARCAFLLCLFLLLPFKAAFSDEHDILSEAASSHEWQVLLHYERGVFGNRSLVDDPDFFLNKNGKYDPYAEILSLYENIYGDNLRGEGSAVCRFPLRAEFLAEKLGKPLSDLHLDECIELKEFMDSINPVKASIIFPFYHMNSPASMFGHTLIRFDSSLDSKLVSTAITYAADYNGTDGGIMYAVKGVTGLYAGRSEILPYHRKIREYDNINQRDIWEYELKLTPEEVRRMVLHSYEIQHTWSRYYFFDENCAYNLLFIIEAAKPESHLTEGFLWVIPIDTIYILRDKGLLGEAVFRPSQSTRMAEMLKDMEPAIYQAAVKAIEQDKLDIPEDFNNKDKIRLLDFWIEYTQFKNRKKEVNQYTEELIGVLRRRAAIPEKIEYNFSVPKEPLEGHRPSKISIKTGSSNGSLFSEINWRPALHTPEDSDIGFLEGSSLAFFDITVRKEENEDLILKKLSFVDIYSLASVTEIFSPVSWKMNFGLEHLDEQHSTAAFINPGGGKAYKVYGGLLYGLFNTKIRASTGYEEGFSAGAGLEGGFSKSFGDFKVRLSADIMRYGLGYDTSEGALKLDAHYYITPDLSLSAGFKNGLADDNKDDVYMSLGLNF